MSEDMTIKDVQRAREQLAKDIQSRLVGFIDATGCVPGVDVNYVSSETVDGEESKVIAEVKVQVYVG